MDNIYQSFDSFGRYEVPVLTLCNPNRLELGQLADVLDFDVVLRFNSVSEISFKYPYKITDTLKSPMYEKIVAKRVIYASELGYFIIQSNEEYNDGANHYKQVTAVSCEIELSSRKLNLFSGTFKFYDPLKPNETLLGQVISSIPHWEIGTIDAQLWNKYRTFDVDDNTIYNFLMTDVEEAYECIFTFNTFDRTINAYSLQSVIKNTDIYVSYENLTKDTNLEEVTDEIVTVLGCYGGGDLSIAGVNPMGSDQIFNFDYFKPMMSDGLKNALNSWETKIKNNTQNYKNNLASLKTKNTSLLSEKAKLISLQAQATATEGVQTVQIQGGIDKTQPDTYAATVAKLERERKAVATQQGVVNKLENEIKNLKDAIKNINNSLKMSTNLDVNQIKELNSYMFESTYQNDAFIKTSKMNEVEIQEVQQELYDQSVGLLKRLSEPRFNFTINTVNPLFIEHFKPYLSDLELGSCLNIEVHDDEYTNPILLEIHYSYSDPDNFQMIFGNRYRLSDPSWQFSDLYGETAKAGSTVDFKGTGWTDWKDEQPTVENFVNSALDLTLNNIINNAHSLSFTMNENGLKGTQKLENGQLSNKQLWMTNNVLAFSNDGFKTVKTAIGEIVLPNGGTAYGVGADVLIGKAIFGSQMTISNENNTIIMDSNGFSMTTNNGTSRIIMNPATGIHLQNKVNGVWKDAISLDQNGNASFTGNITSSSGKIGGFTITSDSLYSTNVGISNNVNKQAFWAGNNDPAKAPFRVNHNGYLVSSSGKIGGFNITSDRLYSDAVRNPNWWSEVPADIRYSNVIDLRTNGTGRVGLMVWNTTGAWFNGNIYAKNLEKNGFSRPIVNDKFQSESIEMNKFGPTFTEWKDKTDGDINANSDDIANLIRNINDLEDYLIGLIMQAQNAANEAISKADAAASVANAAQSSANSALSVTNKLSSTRQYIVSDVSVDYDNIRTEDGNVRVCTGISLDRGPLSIVIGNL